LPEKIRLALVGCGTVMQRHIEGYQELLKSGMRTFTVAATCDPVLDNAREAASKMAEFQGSAPKTYASLGEMLRNEGLTAADVAVPHGYHHTTVIPCLEAGLDVMCEKPLGVSMRAGRMMVEAAERNNRLLATAANFRRFPGQRAMKWAMIDERMIGEPQVFFCQEAGQLPSRPGGPRRARPRVFPSARVWRMDVMMSGGGPIMDSGYHYMETLRYFFGDAERIYAETKNFRGPGPEAERGGVKRPQPDSWLATLTFKGGLVGTWAYAATPGMHFRLIMYYGSEGSVEDETVNVYHSFQREGSLQRADGTVKTLEELKEAYANSLSEGERDRVFPYGLTHGTSVECWDFLDAVANRRKPEVDGWTGLKAKAMCEAIFESAWANRAVRVEDVFEGRVEDYQKAINEHWNL